MIEAKGACSGIVLGNARTERVQRTVGSPSPRRVLPSEEAHLLTV